MEAGDDFSNHTCGERLRWLLARRNAEADIGRFCSALIDSNLASKLLKTGIGLSPLRPFRYSGSIRANSTSHSTACSMCARKISRRVRLRLTAYSALGKLLYTIVIASDVWMANCTRWEWARSEFP